MSIKYVRRNYFYKL